MSNKILFHDTGLSGLKLIEPLFSEDSRGYFLKFFERQSFAEHGIIIESHEEFESLSDEGVIRGLHFQRNHWQSKLVRCIAGELFDVVVDLRKGSPTFGKWEGFYLSEQNRKMVFIPVGFAHGFLSMRDGTRMFYLCGDRYDPESDGGIRWDDPDIGVGWPLNKLSNDVILSAKDKNLPYFSSLIF